MLILSKVCAEFHDPAGTVLFAIHPDELLKPLQAPESIRQDPLFDMMVQDKSLEVVEKKEDLRRVEKDPLGQETEDKRSAAPAETKASGRKSENKG